MTLTSFVDLLGTYQQGRDFTVTTRAPQQTHTAVLAIHGGHIEWHTDLVATAIADHARHGLYVFDGHLPDDSPRLRLPSVGFDDPRCLLVLACAQRAVSVHGCSGPDAVTYVGGLDNYLANAVRAELSGAGFVTQPAPEHLAGTDPDNVVNRCRSGRGVQLELTLLQRNQLKNNPGKLAAYAAAVSVALLTP